MPDVWSREDADFLRELDRLGRDGLNQQEAAARLGVAPGTINYRVNRTRRLKIVQVFRLEDARTGESLADLLDRGEIVVADPVAEPAGAAA
jgi:hypothetical protein